MNNLSSSIWVRIRGKVDHSMVKVNEPPEGLGHRMLILSGKVVITSTAIVLSAYGP